jgi:hypothetical protein
MIDVEPLVERSSVGDILSESKTIVYKVRGASRSLTYRVQTLIYFRMLLKRNLCFLRRITKPKIEINRSLLLEAKKVVPERPACKLVGPRACCLLRSKTCNTTTSIGSSDCASRPIISSFSRSTAKRAACKYVHDPLPLHDPPRKKSWEQRAWPFLKVLNLDLKDILENQEIELDIQFKYHLIHDIIKVIRSLTSGSGSRSS